MKLVYKFAPMFDKIDSKQIPTQAKRNGVVVVKKGGRPPKPNLKRYDIKIDKGIHAQLVKCADASYTTKSSIVNQALIHYFNTHKTST